MEDSWEVLVYHLLQGIFFSFRIFSSWQQPYLVLVFNPSIVRWNCGHRRCTLLLPRGGHVTHAEPVGFFSLGFRSSEDIKQVWRYLHPFIPSTYPNEVPSSVKQFLLFLPSQLQKLPVDFKSDSMGSQSILLASGNVSPSFTLDWVVSLRR